MFRPQQTFEKLEKRRQQLGMSKTAVSRRSGVSLTTVKRLLAGDEQRPSLANLHAVASALGATIQLGAEQELDPHELRQQQAQYKAKKLVGYVQGTMALEAQAVDALTLRHMVEQTTAELLAGGNQILWDD